MPIGNFSIVVDVVQVLWGRKVSTVLDLGCGMGLYGAIIRQWLDYGVNRDTIIIGVEAHPAYENPLWDCYTDVNRITIQRQIEIEEAHPSDGYDAILLLDVIEHLNKKEGASILKRLKALLSEKGVLLVATPVEFAEQGAVHGNEYERHLSHWTVLDFTNLGFTMIRDQRPDRYGHTCLLAQYAR